MQRDALCLYRALIKILHSVPRARAALGKLLGELQVETTEDAVELWSKETAQQALKERELNVVFAAPLEPEHGLRVFDGPIAKGRPLPERLPQLGCTACTTLRLSSHFTRSMPSPTSSSTAAFCPQADTLNAHSAATRHIRSPSSHIPYVRS